MLNLPLIWAGYEDKRQVDGIEAIEFYLSWPARFGKDCYFVMFSFNYDVTMLLKGLRQGRSKNWHYDRVWEIWPLAASTSAAPPSPPWRRERDYFLWSDNVDHLGE